MVAHTDIFFLHTEGQEEVLAVASPVGEPFEVGAGLAEELKLHLLELTGTEDEVAGGDLVTEGLTDLTDAEGKLLTGGTSHVVEVDEDALCSFGTEVDRARAFLGNTDKGLEHQVELTDRGEVAASAIGAGDLVLLDVCHHFVVRPACGVIIQIVLECVVLDELIRAVTRAADLTVHKGVGEAAEVTRCDPGLGVHNDRAVETDVVGGLIRFSPCSPVEDT